MSLYCYIINNNLQLTSKSGIIFKPKKFNIEDLKKEISNVFYIPKVTITKLYYLKDNYYYEYNILAFIQNYNIYAKINELYSNLSFSIDQLRNENLYLKNNYENIKNTSETRISELSRENQNNQSRISELSRENQNNQSRISQLSQENQINQNRISQLSQDNQKNKSEISKLNQKNEELNQKIKEEENLRKEEKEKFNKFKKAFEEIKKDIEKKHIEISKKYID